MPDPEKPVNHSVEFSQSHRASAGSLVGNGSLILGGFIIAKGIIEGFTTSHEVWAAYFVQGTLFTAQGIYKNHGDVLRDAARQLLYNAYNHFSQ
jgi:hypothetical protein